MRPAFRVLLLALAMRAASAAPAQQPWLVPHDPVLAGTRSDEYAWRLFVALNWPADLSARRADPTASLGATRPVVWETWANTHDVYRSGGADPGPWQSTRPLAAAGGSFPPERRFESLAPDALPNLKHVVGGVMLPMRTALVGTDRLTETRMNRLAYEYLRATGLYCLDEQVNWYRQGRSVAFPAGAVQIKAKWRPISAAERRRYHTVEIRRADGTRRLYGLMALHIATKDLPTWFWATFEHIDNASLPGEGWRLPSRDTFACGSRSPDCNRAPRGLRLGGTVWRFYRLRGTLTSYLNAAGEPSRLGNSAFETGMQTTSSCITCHARSTIGLVNGQAARLPILAQGNGAPPGSGARRGFLGVPSSDWFRVPGDEAGAERPLLSLDFVWSLAQAKPRELR